MNKIQKEIKRISDEFEKLHSILFELPSGEYNKREDELFNQVQKLSDNAGEKLAPGKHVRFGVADGYAHYIVLNVRKREVSVEHLKVGDCWHFPDCFLDERRNELVIPRPVVEKTIGFENWKRSVFRK